jgi:hypothetical protein
MVRAGVELPKFHRYWPDQLLRPIGIGGHLVTFWQHVRKDTHEVIEAGVGQAMPSLQHQHLQVKT